MNERELEQTKKTPTEMVSSYINYQSFGQTGLNTMVSHQSCLNLEERHFDQPNLQL